MFIHGGILHIAFNMWCLWDLGALCESLYGRWTYFAIYMITGVGGGLASLAWNPGTFSVGASGAIFGLAGALIASFYLGEFSLPRAAIKGTLMSLLFFAGFNLFFGMLPGIDNSAHIGGLDRRTDTRCGRSPSLLQMRAKSSRRDCVSRSCASRRWIWRAAMAGRADENGSSLSGPGRIQGDPVARWKMIIEQNPDSAPAHFALAQTYFEQQKFPEAEAEFKKVVELEPKNARGPVLSWDDLLEPEPSGGGQGRHSMG